MKAEERIELIDLLNRWERQYPVEEWKINDIHVWPLLKMRVFNNRFAKINSTRSVKKKHSESVLNFLWKASKGYLSLLTFKIKEVDYLFTAGKDHRVEINNMSFNRYFDPMMDDFEAEGSSSKLIEYNSNKRPSGKYRADRVLYAGLIVNFYILQEYLKGTKKYEFREINSFKKELGTAGFDPDNILNTIRKQTVRINAWSGFYNKLIKKSKAKAMSVLCYYANPAFGAILAAKRNNLASYDMQHGTQGPMHPVYTYSKIPSEGFNIVPDYFYCWDKSSYDHIKRWSGIGKHQPILFGNPWNRFIENNINASQYNLSRFHALIVVTLQPVYPLISDKLIQIIKATFKKYNWWIRFHPRMSISMKDEVYKLLGENKDSESINFDDSIRIPLPVLLTKSSLHISKYSGSIIEAAAAGVMTIITDQIGVENFYYIINEGKAINGVYKSQGELLEIIRKQVER